MKELEVKFSNVSARASNGRGRKCEEDFEAASFWGGRDYIVNIEA